MKPMSLWGTFHILTSIDALYPNPYPSYTRTNILGQVASAIWVLLNSRRDTVNTENLSTHQSHENHSARIVSPTIPYCRDSPLWASPPTVGIPSYRHSPLWAPPTVGIPSCRHSPLWTTPTEGIPHYGHPPQWAFPPVDIPYYEHSPLRVFPPVDISHGRCPPPRASSGLALPALPPS